MISTMCIFSEPLFSYLGHLHLFTIIDCYGNITLEM